MIFVAAIHTRLRHCRKLLKLYYAVNAKAFALWEKCRRMPTDEGVETINELVTALQKGLHFIKKLCTEVNQMSGRFDPAFLFIGRWWRCVSYFWRLLNTILHNYPWGKSCICSRCLTELRTDKSVRVTLTLPRLPAIRRTLCRGVCSFVFRAAKTTVTIFFAR